MNHSPIIVALDVETSAEARKLVSALGDGVSFYKVGPELYAAAGMDFVRELKGQGHRVFLDLKFYDISETVKRAVAQVSRVAVDFLTVHASVAVMEAAVEGRENAGLRLARCRRAGRPAGEECDGSSHGRDRLFATRSFDGPGDHRSASGAGDPGCALLRHGRC
jgi:hypothetical protein